MCDVGPLEAWHRQTLFLELCQLDSGSSHAMVDADEVATIF